MNNKPVAWMSIHEGVYSPSFEYLFSRTKKEGFIPLYTHPVKEHLTYKDIAEVMVETDPLELGKVPTKVIIEFAEALLRKAQE